MKSTLNVPEISCDHCKESIEGAVADVEGVDQVEVAIQERTVDVTFDGREVTFTRVVAAIEGQGYEVQS
jgi:copper chaperone